MKDLFKNSSHPAWQSEKLITIPFVYGQPIKSLMNRLLIIPAQEATNDFQFFKLNQIKQIGGDIRGQRTYGRYLTFSKLNNNLPQKAQSHRLFGRSQIRWNGSPPPIPISIIEKYSPRHFGLNSTFPIEMKREINEKILNSVESPIVRDIVASFIIADCGRKPPKELLDSPDFNRIFNTFGYIESVFFKTIASANRCYKNIIEEANEKRNCEKLKLQSFIDSIPEQTKTIRILSNARVPKI